jgi:hypothetical protein
MELTAIMLNFDPRRVLRVAALLSLGVAAPALAPESLAQSPALGEVARKEQERRKTQKPTGKVYTNKDLPESAKRPPVAAPPQGQAPASGSAEATQAKEGDKPAEKPAAERDEAWWRTRMTQAREELRRNEAFAEALQTRINSLSAEFTSRDDPFQRAKVGDDRDKTLAELARVKADIARTKQQIEDIEDEARKASVPPGWLR